MRTAPPTVPTSEQTRIKWASGLNIIAGLWTLISPWVLGASALGAVMTSNVIVGIIVAVLAAIRSFGAYQATWLSGINVILGIWLFISAFVFGGPGVLGALFASNLIFGVIIVVLGIGSGMASNRRTA